MKKNKQRKELLRRIKNLTRSVGMPELFDVSGQVFTLVRKYQELQGKVVELEEKLSLSDAHRDGLSLELLDLTNQHHLRKTELEGCISRNLNFMIELRKELVATKMCTFDSRTREYLEADIEKIEDYLEKEKSHEGKTTTNEEADSESCDDVESRA